MDVAVAAALAAAGLALLCLGGNWLVSGGVGIARRLGMSPLVIGMTVVAYGTSTPELAASLAAAGEHGGLILGNVVGSNIANMGMVVGVAAAVAPLAVARGALRREVPIMVGASLLLVALSADGEVSRHDGMLLVAALGAFTAYAYLRSRRGRAAAGPARAAGPWARPAALVAAGAALLGAGAWLAVENAVVLARALGLSDLVIGVTVIAIGTSLPELVTSLMAVRRGHADIGVGNIIGSNIYNVLMIMGLASAVSAVQVPGGAMADYAVMSLFALAPLAALRSGRIGRPAGLALAAAYAAYLASALLG